MDMMTRSPIFLTAFLSVALHAHADTAQDDVARSTAVPYKMTGVVMVHVATPSAFDEPTSADEYKSFLITTEQATYFLNHARSISERSRMHDLTVSPCYALGTVKFASGYTATWTIIHGGAGLMTPQTGKFKGTVISLHCKKCEDKDM